MNAEKMTLVSKIADRLRLGFVVDFDAWQDSLIIETPFHYDDGDAIRLFATLNDDGSISLDDSGESLWKMQASSYPLTRKVCDRLSKRFGVALKDGQLSTKTTADGFNDAFYGMLKVIIETAAVLRMTDYLCETGVLS